MEFIKYSIKCPECYAGIQLICDSYECIVLCKNCKKPLYVTGESIKALTSRQRSIFKKYSNYFRLSGKVIHSRKPPRRIEFITDNRLKILKESIENIRTVDDLLDKL